MVSFLKQKSESRKFYIIYYCDPDTDENKYHFADTFQLACDRAESIIRELPKETPIKIRIFEEVLTFIKHPLEEIDKKKKSKDLWGIEKDIDWGLGKKKKIKNKI